MMDLQTITRPLVRCRHCFNQTAAKSSRCEHCGDEVEPGAPKTLVGRIKRALGIEISSEIIVINLQDGGYFFTKSEIDFLLSFKNLTVLGLEDVPDRETMFYKSKTIRKPLVTYEIK